MTKLALILADEPGMCVLPTGTRAHVNAARSSGFTPKTRAEFADILSIAEGKASNDLAKDRVFAKADLEQLQAEIYAFDIHSLPEAKGRPRAAALIVKAHTARSMPIAKAKAFLANLPMEGQPTAATAQPAGLTLREHVEHAFAEAQTQAASGNRRAQERAISLGWAIRCADRGTDITRALDLCCIDPKTL